MRFGRRSAERDASRRVDAALLVMVFAGALPVLMLAWVFAEIALGHPDQRARVQVSAVEMARAGAWVGAWVACGALLAGRRVAGLYSAMGLLGMVIVSHAVVRPFGWAPAVAAVAGLAILARARRSLRHPGSTAAA